MFTLAQQRGFAHPDYFLHWLTAEQLQEVCLHSRGPKTDDPATWTEEEIREFVKRGR